MSPDTGDEAQEDALLHGDDLEGENAHDEGGEDEGDEDEFDDDFDDDDDDDDDEDDDDDDDGDDEDGDYEPGDVNARTHADYEAGDVNTIEAARAGGRSTEAGLARGGTPVAVLTYLAESMADDPDAVVIREEERRGSSVLRLHVAPGDMGRVIGRRGRTAQAVRTLVAAAGARDGVQVAVDIVDD